MTTRSHDSVASNDQPDASGELGFIRTLLSPTETNAKSVNDQKSKDMKPKLEENFGRMRFKQVSVTIKKADPKEEENFPEDTDEQIDSKEKTPKAKPTKQKKLRKKSNKRLKSAEKHPKDSPDNEESSANRHTENGTEINNAEIQKKKENLRKRKKKSTSKTEETFQIGSPHFPRKDFHTEAIQTRMHELQDLLDDDQSSREQVDAQLIQYTKGMLRKCGVYQRNFVVQPAVASNFTFAKSSGYGQKQKQKKTKKTNKEDKLKQPVDPQAEVDSPPKNGQSSDWDDFFYADSHADESSPSGDRLEMLDTTSRNSSQKKVQFVETSQHTDNASESDSDWQSDPEDDKQTSQKVHRPHSSQSPNVPRVCINIRPNSSKPRLSRPPTVTSSTQFRSSSHDGEHSQSDPNSDVEIPVRTRSYEPTDCHLKNVENPEILDWLQEKNRQLRKKLKEDRKKKIEENRKKAEEKRAKEEKLEESQKLVKQWMKKKKKELRLLQRKQQNKENTMRTRPSSVYEWHRSSRTSALQTSGEQVSECTCGFVAVQQHKEEEARKAQLTAKQRVVEADREKLKETSKKQSLKMSVCSVHFSDAHTLDSRSTTPNLSKKTTDDNNSERNSGERLSYDKWLKNKKIQHKRKKAAVKKEEQELADSLDEDTKRGAREEGKEVTIPIPSKEEKFQWTLNIPDGSRQERPASACAPSTKKQSTRRRPTSAVTQSLQQRQPQMSNRADKIHANHPNPYILPHPPTSAKKPQTSSTQKPNVKPSSAYKRVKYQQKSWDNFSEHVWEDVVEQAEKDFEEVRPEPMGCDQPKEVHGDNHLSYNKPPFLSVSISPNKEKSADQTEVENTSPPLVAQVMSAVPKNQNKLMAGKDTKKAIKHEFNVITPSNTEERTATASNGSQTQQDKPTLDEEIEEEIEEHIDEVPVKEAHVNTNLSAKGTHSSKDNQENDDLLSIITLSNLPQASAQSPRKTTSSSMKIRSNSSESNSSSGDEKPHVPSGRVSISREESVEDISSKVQDEKGSAAGRDSISAKSVTFSEEVHTKIYEKETSDDEDAMPKSSEIMRQALDAEDLENNTPPPDSVTDLMSDLMQNAYRNIDQVTRESDDDF